MPKLKTGGWHVSPLFDQAAHWVPDADAPFCVYSWDAAGGTDEPDPTLIAPVGEVPAWRWTHRDCHVVAPLASESLDIAGSDLNEAWLDAVNRVVVPDGGSDVFVAVIDTARSTPLGPYGQSPHGRGMALAVQNLVCSNGGCAANIHSELALDLEVDASGEVIRRPIVGGFFGYQSVIARRIVDAVNAWHASDPTATSRLIVNLSFGWYPRYTELANGYRRAAVDAVAEALQLVRCAGGMTFAATGNDPANSSPATGPMHPAAYGAVAPIYTCPDGGPGPAGPVLAAVGGIEPGGAPIRNQRAAAEPELVAPAFNVVVTDEVGVPFDAYTGTSVATAVASATAASIWQVAPGLDALDVLDLMYSSGASLGRTADACYAPPCREVSRIDFCHAVEAAVGVRCATSTTGLCADPPTFECDAVSEDNPSLDGAILEALADALTATDPAIDASAPMTAYDFTQQCDAIVETHATVAPDPACPHQMYPSDLAAPFETDTQPGVGGCEVCVLAKEDGLADLFMDIALDTNGKLYAPQLVLTSRNGTDQIIDLVPLVGEPLNPGQSYVIEQLRVEPHDYASLTYDLQSSGRSYAVSDEIITQDKVPPLP